MVDADGAVVAGADVTALVARAQDGDGAAGAALLDRYGPLLAAAIARCSPRLPGGAVSEDDLRQEAHLHFFELLRAYRGDSAVSFGAYLKQKLRWRLANYVRAERRRQRGGEPLSTAHLDLVQDTLRAGLGGDLENPRLRSALRQLSPKRRAVLFRLHCQGQPVAEVATSLGVTPQAVMATRRRAEAQLRESMGGSSGERDRATGRAGAGGRGDD